MDLVITRDPGRNILKWGRDNMYPAYLLSLVKGQPQHGGIVNGKTKYLTGLQIKASTPQGEAWLQKANPKQSHYELSEMYNKTYTTYGCRAIKIVPNLIGTPIWYFHMDFGKCRISECETMVRYCEDWFQSQRYGVIDYPIWYPGCKEISVFLQRNYNPTVREIEAAYPGLEYESAIKDIDTLKRIQNARNSLVINDFSAGTITTIFTGKADPVKEKNIADRINGNHAGDENFGKNIVNFTDPDSKAAEVAAIPTAGLDKKYLEVTVAATKNVFAAHNVPPELYNYIADGAPMFDKQKLVDQNELHMNTYVIPNQKNELEMLEMFYNLTTGQVCEFSIEQFDPIGLDLPLDNQVVVDALNGIDTTIIPKWLNKKYKLGIQEQQAAPGAPPSIGGITPMAQVNDHLKNLTGKQSQGIDRIVRKFKSGNYSEAQARILLKPFGLTDQEIKEYLGIAPASAGQPPIKQRVAFAKQIDFFALFDKYAHDVNPDDDILETHFIDSKIRFAESVDVKTNTAVLNEIKKDPALTNEQVAGILGISVVTVAAAIKWLLATKMLINTGSILKPTDKAQNAKKTIIYTEYNYDKRPDVPGSVIMATTRDFCRMLYSKFQEGRKALTFDAIENITNEFGEDAWDYRGGWYTNPNTQDTTPWCRHVWVGTTKIKYE